MEIELPRDFKELFVSLNTNNVRYLLIGGYAVGVYGYSRTTNDIDIFVADDAENIQRLTEALTDFGIADGDLSGIFAKKRSLVEIGVEPVKVQLMNFADGIVFDEAFERRTMIEIEEIVISTIGKEDLIANKLASGRHKDLDDVEMMQRLSESDQQGN
ncbi:nucleotidyl transferase AbiEii/AbiGii toxin family protein [soil metagenome]